MNFLDEPINNNSILNEFYKYLDNNINNYERNCLSKFKEYPNMNDKVCIISQYPTVLKRYKTVFDDHNDKLPYNDLSAMITEFIEMYPSTFVKEFDDELGLDNYGPMLEEIFNFYIKTNKNLRNIPYPAINFSKNGNIVINMMLWNLKIY